MKQATIWIGFDANDYRQAAAFAVARESIKRRLSEPVPVHGLVLSALKAQGLYWRPTEKRLGKLWDVISNAPMSTEFAISRFLVPHLAKSGLALFMDSDMLVRGDLTRLFRDIEARKSRDHCALWCVQHNHEPTNETKMEGHVQTQYFRKNWSSVMVFDCDHPANKRLSVELVNSARGIDLHGFCWLKDEEIGALDPKWNYLVGHTKLKEGEPKIIHYTDGGPWFTSMESVPYADEWRNELTRWASWH